MLSYEEMLEKAYKEIPKELVETKERFEIPKVRGHIEGNKTVISNFFQIAKVLNRDPKHLMKFLQRELATPATIQGELLILGSKVSSGKINAKINEYAKLFVICPECGKPDTSLIKEKGVLMLKCHACGAKHPVRAKI